MKNSTNKFNQKSPSIDELKEISRSWSPAEWESYLSSLEIPRKEVITAKLDDINEEFPWASTGVSGLSEEMSTQLKKAIDGLSPQQRRVIYAKYWDGLSENKIAIRQGIARTTVQMHLSRAITKLNNSLSSKIPLSKRTKYFLTLQAKSQVSDLKEDAR